MTKTIQSTDLTAIDLQGYSGINGITVTATGGRYALSFDKGVTWKSRAVTGYASGAVDKIAGTIFPATGGVSVTPSTSFIPDRIELTTHWYNYDPRLVIISGVKSDGTTAVIYSGGAISASSGVVIHIPVELSNIVFKSYKVDFTSEYGGSGSPYCGVSLFKIYESVPSYIWETILASEIQTKGMTLDILNTLKPNDFEPIFQRTQLYFLISLEAAESITGLTVFLPANQAPKATNITLNPATIHAGDAILSADLLDQEEQASDYRVLVDADIIRDWTPFGYSASISETININNLTMGSHVAHIQTRDSMAKQADYTVNFTRINGTPTASVVWDSKHISAILGDPDNDKIKYQLTINGVIKIPWTDWVDAGFNFVYYFKRGELPVDQSSNLKIEYMDAVGATGVWTGVVAGTYFNLMFKDTLGNYYSNDYGTTLKILDLGTLIAGSATGYAEIMVKNETGFPVQNIQVYAENPYTGVNILLSYSGTPFVPVNPWVIPSVVADGDEVPLYIQCTADESAKHGGDFKLHIVGDLILPEIP